MKNEFTAGQQRYMCVMSSFAAAFMFVTWPRWITTAARVARIVAHWRGFQI